MSIWLTELADVLRAGGVNVIELPGWQKAAYPKWGGFSQRPTHVMCHHTASNPGTDPKGDIAFITQTHPLKPICNLYLSRSGTYYVIAAGQVCTNGAGTSKAWNGGVPDDAMNHYAISIEAANNGVGEPWPYTQILAYIDGVAALCAGYGIPVEHVRAHHEWAPGRKIDPAGQSPYALGGAKWNMDQFRSDVNSAIDVLTTVSYPPTPTTPPPSSQEPEMRPLDPPHRVDTRVDNTPLQAGEIRRFAVMMGGSSVLANITVVPQNSAGGYLVAFNDAHDAPPNAASVNWNGNNITGNLAYVPTNGGWIKVMATQPCHVVIDTVGYTE